MLFAVNVYMKKIEDEKKTCHREHDIGSRSEQDTLKCKKYCDHNKNCKFFFINNGGYCELYSSCTKYRTPLVVGSTFEKITGTL